MSPKIHKFIYEKLMGWKATEPIIPEDKALVLAAPHTSIWDFAVGFFYYRSLGGKLKVMIKKESFFFPVSLILRAMGGFPIDRKNPQQMMMKIIHEINSTDKKVVLVICPEGTRKAVHKWKTGYHTIAKACNLPVYLAHIDWAKKEFGRGQKVELTDDARADTDRIQQIYEDMHLTAKYPEGYTTK